MSNGHEKLTNTEWRDAAWDRLSTLERDSAAMKSDIRGIYAGLDEIRDVLVRMQENNKPNLSNLFISILATCSILITVGGLSLAPVNRNITSIREEVAILDARQVEVLRDGLTEVDGRRIETEVKSQAADDDARLEAQILRNEDNILVLMSRVAEVEGRVHRREIETLSQGSGDPR